MSKLKFYCFVHQIELPEGQNMCWRCQTRGIKELNELVPASQPKRSAHGMVKFIEMKKYPEAWICIN